MKKRFFHPTAQALHCALVTLCVSFGVSRSVCAALALTVCAQRTFLCCLALTLLFLLFDCLGRLQALVFPALLALIAATAALLMTPAASKSGEATEPVAALFTAVSAVCVTGLVVVDTATHWSAFGQCVLLLAIQIGGLGVMTVLALTGASACASGRFCRRASPPRRSAASCASSAAR